MQQYLSKTGNSPGFSASLRVRDLRLVSLDIGNTLVTSSEPGLATRLTRATQSGVETDDIISLLHTRAATQPLLDEICERLSIPPIDLRSYRAPEAIVVPGAVEALTLLRTLDVRVVSLSNIASLDAIPLPVDICSHLDAQYQSFRIGAAKPSVAAFRAMLEGEGVDACCCVHIGDSWRCDAIGALSAGMGAIWLQPNSGGTTRSSRDGLIVVHSISEAVEILVKAISDD